MIIELIVLIPIPAFFFTAWGLEYRWAGVLCVLIFALPALYNLGLNVYVKLEEDQGKSRIRRLIDPSPEKKLSLSGQNASDSDNRRHSLFWGRIRWNHTFFLD